MSSIEQRLEQKPALTKISLNAEQTKRFLSAFIPEAIELAKKRKQQASAKANNSGS